mgnify:CR=1 FL=1
MLSPFARHINMRKIIKKYYYYSIIIQLIIIFFYKKDESLPFYNYIFNLALLVLFTSIRHLITCYILQLQSYRRIYLKSIYMILFYTIIIFLKISLLLKNNDFTQSNRPLIIILISDIVFQLVYILLKISYIIFCNCVRTI